MTYHVSEDIREYERLMLQKKMIESKLEEIGTGITVFMEQEGADETPILPFH